jgi:hypothetical protein
LKKQIPISNTDQSVALLLVRETTELEGRGLVHAFASDTHPEASGPLLELSPISENHSPKPTASDD